MSWSEAKAELLALVNLLLEAVLRSLHLTAQVKAQLPVPGSSSAVVFSGECTGGAQWR